MPLYQEELNKFPRIGNGRNWKSFSRFTSNFMNNLEGYVFMKNNLDGYVFAA